MADIVIVHDKVETIVSGQVLPHNRILTDAGFRFNFRDERWYLPRHLNAGSRHNRANRQRIARVADAFLAAGKSVDITIEED